MMKKKITNGEKDNRTRVVDRLYFFSSLKIGIDNGLKPILFLFILILLSSTGFANGEIAKMVRVAKAQGSVFVTVDSLLIADSTYHSSRIQAEVLHPKYFDFDATEALKLINYREQYISITLPNVTENNEDLVLDLIAMPEYYYDFRITTGSGLEYTGWDVNLRHYRGVVRNREEESVVFFSVSDHDVSINISIDEIAEYQIYKDQQENIHVFHDYLEIAHLNNVAFLCGSDGDYPAPIFGIETRSKGPDKCIYLFVEAEYEAYLEVGSDIDELEENILDVINKVISKYKDIGVTLRLRELKIWDIPDPYTYNTVTGSGYNFGQSDMSDKKHDYVDHAIIPTDVNLVHFLSSFGSNGVAGTAGEFICLSSQQDPWPSIQNYTAWCSKGSACFRSTVKTMAHEIGHSLSSPHTFACAWNGNCTRLDNSGAASGATCGGTFVPSCGSAPNPSDGEGTVMSYGNSLKYFNAFGDQPAELIENFVNSQDCLTECVVSCDDLKDIINVGPTSSHDVNSGDDDYRHSALETNAYNEIDAGGNASYYSAGAVFLRPDFIANSGSVFVADIKSCNNYNYINHGTAKIKPNSYSNTLNEESVNDDFNIHAYPNPTKGVVVVESTGSSIQNLSLVNTLGKTTYEMQGINSKRFELDISEEAKGIYFLQVINSLGNRETIKIVLE